MYHTMLPMEAMALVAENMAATPMLKMSRYVTNPATMRPIGPKLSYGGM
jgi:hypothetical protein